MFLCLIKTSTRLERWPRSSLSPSPWRRMTRLTRTSPTLFLRYLIKTRAVQWTFQSSSWLAKCRRFHQSFCISHFIPFSFHSLKFSASDARGKTQLDIRRVWQGRGRHHRPRRAQRHRARPVLPGGDRGAGRDPRYQESGEEILTVKASRWMTIF